MNNLFKNIINKNVITNSNGVAMIRAPGNTKGSRNRLNNIIQNLYGLQSGIVPETANPQVTEEVNKIINAIVRPYRAAYANGEINSRRFAAMLGFARDIAWRLKDYSINSVYASTDEEAIRKAELNAAGAINISARELMTLIFSEKVSMSLYKNKTTLTAKSAMYTTFHEVGHALMRMIPDHIKVGMIKEFEAARASWFASLPDGDVRKSLSMPEYDWHYTAGMRNFSFSRELVTGYPIGQEFSPSQKTYEGMAYSGNSKTKKGRGTGANFFASAMVSLALAQFAEDPNGLGNSAKAKKLRETAEVEYSGVGRQGQLGFKAGSGPIAPFMALFNLGIGYNLNELMYKSKAPVVEIWTTQTSDPSSPYDISRSNGSLSAGAIHKMIQNGEGFITTDPDNANNAKITTILPNGKVQVTIINAKAYLTELADEYLELIKGQSDGGKLTALADGNILKEFIYGSTGIDHLRQSQNIRRTSSGTAENRIYRLTSIDEWLAENTAAYCRDYYMLGNYSEEVCMTGDIVASLFVHASSGGDSRLTRRIISGIFQNTIPESRDASESGTEYYRRYGDDNDKALKTGNQQSGSTSPPMINKNILPKGMSVAEESILKSGRGATFSASSVKTVKEWVYNLSQLRDWAIESAANTVPSMKSIAKAISKIKSMRSETKAMLKAPLTYGGEGLVGTLIGQIEQIARITDNDMIRDLGKRLYNRPDTGEISRNTFTEDMTVYRNYWQAVFDSIIKKHLGDTIKRSSESRDRLLSLRKAFDVSGKTATVKQQFVDKLAEYVLNVLHPEFNKMRRSLVEAKAYVAEDKWDKLPADLKEYLDSIGIHVPQKLGVLATMILQEEAQAKIDAGNYGKGSKYDNIKFGREADEYLGDYFEEGTIDKLMMDVGRCMSVPKTMPNYETYIKSKFSQEVINCANELIAKWAKPYRKWSESMGETIEDWGTSWRPRVMDSDSIHGIRDGVRNRSDSFILKAASTIYKDNKHQRVLLPASFKKFFEDNDYFIEYGASAEDVNPSKSKLGINQAYRLAEEWRREYVAKNLNKYMTERVKTVLMTAGMSEEKDITHLDDFGFDVDISPVVVTPVYPTPETGLKVTTTKAISIAVALRAYKRFLETVTSADIGGALTGEKEMIDRAIKRLDEQHNRKYLENNLTQIDAFNLARQFSDRVLHKAMGLASSGNGYADIFGGQYGDLNKADSQKERLMECEFADQLLGEFYTNDVRIFGKHYNDSVTKSIIIRHHLPETFWNALQKSVVSNPNSTHYWPDICWTVRRITESDQEESSSGLVNSMLTLAAHSLFMTATSALQFAEPLVFGTVFKQKNFAASAIESAKASGGNLRMVLVSIANSLASVSSQLATLGQYEAKYFPGFKKMSMEDEFYTRLARRIGIVQSKYLENLDTSTADKRGLAQRMSDRALQRFHYSGSGLTAVTDSSRVAVMKSTIMALEQMADEIVTKTRAKNPNGMWIRGKNCQFFLPMK